MKKNEVDYLLYAVTDFGSYPDSDPAESVRAALAGGASVLQLREKCRSSAEIAEMAKPLQKMCRDAGACFIINDDAEAVRLSDADGVHIGQKDHALTEVRKLLGNEKIIGVSVQTVEQAKIACRDGADYLGVGAVFPTSTKSDADDVSYETLQAICAVSTVPVVAIGGISLENLPRLAGSGIDGIAVVSALFGAKDIAGAARKLRQGAAGLGKAEAQV